MPNNLGLPQQHSSSESAEPALLAVLSWQCPPHATLHNLQRLFSTQHVSGHAAPCGRRPNRTKQACSSIGLLQALPAWQDAQQRRRPASTSGRPSLEAPHRCSSGFLGIHWSLHSQHNLPTACRGFAAVSAHASLWCRLIPPHAEPHCVSSHHELMPAALEPAGAWVVAPSMQFASSWLPGAALCAAKQPSKVASCQLTSPLPACRLLQWTWRQP